MNLDFFVANNKEKEQVAKELFYMGTNSSIYFVKVNGEIAGFVSFKGQVLTKIKVKEKFRNSNLSEKLFNWAGKKHLELNQGISGFSLRAISESSKKQTALQRWYRKLGGITNPDDRQVFFFARPKKENLLVIQKKEF